jgi:hypothetical protein
VSLSRRRRRTLRGIERELAASEPGLHAFFLSFNARTGERDRPRVERIAPWPVRMLARLWGGPIVTERVKDASAEHRNDP